MLKSTVEQVQVGGVLRCKRALEYHYCAKASRRPLLRHVAHAGRRNRNRKPPTCRGPSRKVPECHLPLPHAQTLSKASITVSITNHQHCRQGHTCYFCPRTNFLGAPHRSLSAYIHTRSCISPNRYSHPGSLLKAEAYITIWQGVEWEKRSIR